ncbi:SAPS domain-containing protein [Artemisia annua]|uniref:SAPS domain-containing protein n=1 Tax=Artemisia annua TaxID=35608 RepID=A0A2U1MFP7_ARTAN|nr:SAPS domain-containing protein [Artemisia annua]
MKKKCKHILTLMLSNRKLMLLLYRLQMMLNAHLKKDTLERYLVLLLRFGHERMCNLYESIGIRGLNVSNISGDLLMLSNVTFDEQVLPTTHGQLKPPLGKHHLKVLYTVGGLENLRVNHRIDRRQEHQSTLRNLLGSDLWYCSPIGIKLQLNERHIDDCFVMQK